MGGCSEKSASESTSSDPTPSEQIATVPTSTSPSFDSAAVHSTETVPPDATTVPSPVKRHQSSDVLGASPAVAKDSDTATPSKLKKTFCWPVDDLPKTLSKARILMYGYSADVIGPFQDESQNTISNHGNDFLVALVRQISKSVPIISWSTAWEVFSQKR
jgi:hypothetical protein